MQILLINTSDNTGGAAVAAWRLTTALNKNGENATLLVRDKHLASSSSVAMGHGLRARWHFLWERLVVFAHLHLRQNHLWEIDIANCGGDITQTREFSEADVVHLQWVNQGMLSLRTLRKIIDSGKPVVWTMHDLWPATALCHYARGCEKFTTGCDRCPLLPGKSLLPNLARRVWNKKKRTYEHSDMVFVTCSHWLGEQAQRSALLDGLAVKTIPNAIDTAVFHPISKAEVRRELGLPQDKKVILFVAQKVTDERKGAKYLVEALEKLRTMSAEVAENTVVALLGGKSEELASQINLPVFPLGYVRGDERLARVYSAADVFVLPSMEDNLPNTLMEAMACGVPCVGFHVGGIPEMISHERTGYVAREADSTDLARGLHWVLAEADAKALSENALQKVAECYSEQSVAREYINVYNEAISKKGLPHK